MLILAYPSNPGRYDGVVNQINVSRIRSNIAICLLKKANITMEMTG